MIKIFCELMNFTKREINKTINGYLDIYMDFYKNLGPDEGFSSLFPEIIWIENKEKCIQTMIELDAWTRDEHNHNLRPMHEFALHRVLCQTIEDHLDRKVEDKIYSEEYDEEETDDEYILKDLDNVDFYLDVLFQDYDFLHVSDYLEEFFNDPYKFEKEGDVNLDDYVDLMPSDIRNDYLNIRNSLYPKDIETNKNVYTINNKEDFLFHLDRIIDYFSHSITMKSTYKLLWNDNNSPRKEKSAQQLFSFISELYCENNNIDITQEAETGRGPVDFKFSFGNSIKAIAEIKLGSNNLINGLKHQTVQYMRSEKVDFAYYIVIIMDDNERKKVNKVLETANMINSNSQLQIKPIIIDARPNKPPASKTRIVY